MRLLTAFSAALFFILPDYQAKSMDYGSPPVLTITGNVPHAPVSLSVDELEAMGLESMTTVTPWHDGPVTFEGIPMERLMAHAGVETGQIEVAALNNYFVQMPLDAVIKAEGLVATRKNGTRMPVPDKGPLFLIFPFSDRPELKTESYYSWSVWQIRQITVK
jgi:hypothetical protein